jgi:hypothetical protein
MITHAVFRNHICCTVANGLIEGSISRFLRERCFFPLLFISCAQRAVNTREPSLRPERQVLWAGVATSSNDFVICEVLHLHHVRIVRVVIVALKHREPSQPPALPLLLIPRPAARSHPAASAHNGHEMRHDAMHIAQRDRAAASPEAPACSQVRRARLRAAILLGDVCGKTRSHALGAGAVQWL